jgi:hypothetical protein
VAVEIHGDASRRVPLAFTNDLGVRAGLDHQRRAGVPQVVEAQLLLVLRERRRDGRPEHVVCEPLVESVDAPGTTGSRATEVTLATLHSIPAGSYILTGMLWLLGGITPTQVHRFLRAGTDVDETDVFVATASSDEALSFILPHTFTPTGTVTLSCNSFGTSVGTSSAKISALQVQSLRLDPA